MLEKAYGSPSTKHWLQTWTEKLYRAMKLGPK